MNIYVLKLEKDKYYIGKSSNPNIRIDKHFSNNGSSWTQKYKPISVIEIINDVDDFDEDKYTLKYMAKYGIENVRGGSFCEIYLTSQNKKTIVKMLNTAKNQCFICDSPDHFANDCTNNNNNKYEYIYTGAKYISSATIYVGGLVYTAVGYAGHSLYNKLFNKK